MKVNHLKFISRFIIPIIIGIVISKLWFGNEKDTEQKDQNTVVTKNIWTCSMHPQIQRYEFGKCPLCGMNLIQITEDEGNLNTQLKMSEDAIKFADIQTTKLKKSIPNKKILINGKVQIDERNIFSQTAHIAGRIEKLHVNFTGEPVKKGQLLATIYAPDLITAQEELLEALQMKNENPEILTATRRKLKFWKLTDKQIDEIEKNKKVKTEFLLYADLTGIVISLKIALGDHVEQGQVFFQVADLSKLWILFDAYESDLPWIKRGDQIAYEVAAYPGEIFKAPISYIDPVINPKTRVAKVRIEVNNTSGLLKPQMYVYGNINAKNTFKNPKLIIPKTAVMWTGKRSVAYVKLAGTSSPIFEMREIKLGTSLSDHYIIEEGIKEGEEVVTNGTFTVDATAQLSNKYSMMNREVSSKTEKEQNNFLQSSEEDFEIVKKQLWEATKIYFKLKDILVESDSVKVKSKARDLLIFTEKLINNSKISKHWLEAIQQIREQSSKMAKEENIQQQRNHFKILSENIITFNKTFNNVKPIYIQYCFMVDNFSGGSWLSLSKEIRNPYYGNSMLHCGEIKQHIQPQK